MAARTDLNGKKISDYRANFEGVENLLQISAITPSVRRVILASSMLVCKVGYTPKDFNDYLPTTIYGESKVLTEKVIKDFKTSHFKSIIIRPTSIWGPWFGAPYLNFFKLVKKGLFFKFGDSLATKTFGFVGNTISQIDTLLFCDDKLLIFDVYYLGDDPPLNIGDWADSISDTF